MKAFNEQCDAVISLDGSHKRLPIVSAWANSSAVYWINPQAPATALYVKIGNANKSGWNCSLKAYYHPKRGMYRVYVPGKYFTGHYETVYQIVEVDDGDARHVLGEGALRVYRSAIQDQADEIRECCASFPDGKCRRISISYDDTGAPVFDVSVDSFVSGVLPGPLFAYDKAKGAFFRVTGVIDESGTPTLDVAQEPADDGERKYFHDPKTGFYRPMDAAEDSSGVESLVTGDQIV